MKKKIIRNLLKAHCVAIVELFFLFFSTPVFSNDMDEGIRNPDFSSATIVVSGVITDENGQIMPGVNVIEKSTQKGVITDIDGKYMITVSDNATLVFSFIGYQQKEIPVNGQKVLNVQMTVKENVLNEVVAIGYQTLRKSDITGAIASVQASDLNISTSTVGQALVGKVAGVHVSQVSGAPYETTKIRVRGIGSINASSDPLYVIDGYPAGNDMYINPEDIESIDILKDAASAAIYGSRAAGGVVLITTKKGRKEKGKLEYDYQFGINQLSKKVDLLDANQFVSLLIDARNNTYRDLILNAGKPWNDAMFSDVNSVRIGNVGNASAVSIPPEYYNFVTREMIAPAINTDWQDELYRNAYVQRHNLSFSGGNEQVRYYLSGGYQDQPGIIVTTGLTRLNLRANIDADVTPKIKIGGSFALTSSESDEVREGRFNQGPILGALIYMPIFPAYNEDGTLAKNAAASLSSTYGYQSIENPVALASETKISRKEQRSSYNVNTSYQFIPELTFKVNLGMLTYSEKYEFYQPTSLSSGANPPGSPQAIAAAYATARTTLLQDQLAEFTLNFQKQLGKHNLNFLAGYTAQGTTNDVVSVTAKGFSNDDIHEITAKGADPSNFQLNSETGKSKYTLLSYLTRLIYDYNDKYYLSGSFRRDGSSRFGPDTKYGNFPSVSAGWNISKESFYHDWLGNQSTLKLRASWGLSGNNSIGNYNYDQTISSVDGAVFGNTIASAVAPGSIKDKGIGWESTSQFNVGLDLTMFENRLSVIMNGYLSHSTDLLFNQPVSAISGGSTVLTNLSDSKIENKGFDFQLDGKVFQRKDFNLNFSGNFSLNRNKVKDMGGANTIITNGAERSYLTHITTTGQPVGMFYGIRVAGMVTEDDMANIALDDQYFNKSTQSFPEGYKLKGPPRSLFSSNSLKPGDLYFEDVNNDGVVSDLDKDVVGNPYPKFIYAFSLSGNYGNLDFSASFNGSYGNEVLDGQDYYLFNMEASGNQYAEVANRYRSEAEPGNGEIYRASRGGTQSNSTRLSTFYIQDGSYLRCTNITIGYTLPQITAVTNAGISNIRIFAGVDNAFTITDYKGYNPEVDYNDGSNLTPGVDYGKYPLVRAYNLGAKITF
jgi:TonB-linked SusC/RagA family outer membrane protein